MLTLDLPQCELSYFPDFLSPLRAQDYMRQLMEEVPWRQNTIRLFGKVHKEPRLTQLYTDPGWSYTYSGICFDGLPWSEVLATIKAQVEERTQHTYNSCLLNWYRDGKDSNGWHADNESSLGINPVIASVSLGATRDFKIRHNKDMSVQKKLSLTNGSLLLMGGEMQTHYKHQVAKTMKQVGPRINLTFRRLV